MKMYRVGGCVRDEILGIPSKDVDFTVVLDESDFPDASSVVTVPSPFEVMESRLKKMGFKIFLRSPEFLTIRAQFPDYKTARRFAGDGVDGRLTADFVLARKESDYADGRRPDKVEVGSLEDDLARRDFSMNAIAKDADGNLIDPHNGVQDINDRILRAVGNAFDRLTEDALRAVRALRFSVTKDMVIDHELKFTMQTEAVLVSIRENISDERIADELSKMFRYDTVASLSALSAFPLLTEAMFAGRVSLDATMKQRGRGKK